ncbi:hypothetical protein Ahy_A02g009319 [Arachis hypogaea]|uniref:WRKY domain-containing protein n=1 Tax=Arachis hypogaea TaxID=3818 RepID=A0A445EGN9_ARAHY|nr:hypothetical protein Ahy_A02g009319 [Arachis hypogaea]
MSEGCRVQNVFDIHTLKLNKVETSSIYDATYCRYHEHEQQKEHIRWNLKTLKMNTSLVSPLSPPPPPSLLSTPTTITQDFSFFNDTFFENSISRLVNVGDFGLSLYERCPTNRNANKASSSFSISIYVVILESSESQNPALSIIPSNPEVVVSNNNITNNRAVRPKCSVESIVGGNGNQRGDDPDDEEHNIITRLKLRSSTMASVQEKECMLTTLLLVLMLELTVIVVSMTLARLRILVPDCLRILRMSDECRVQNVFDIHTVKLSKVLKLRASTMPSIVDIMSLNDKRNTNSLLKFDFLTERESEKLEDEQNTSLVSPLSPPPPPSLLSTPTTITQDFSFFNDTFFEKSLSGLVNVGDFGPFLYERCPANRNTNKASSSFSVSIYVVILESSESQNPVLSIIPSDPEVVVSNNNITNNRAGGPKHSVESIVGGNGNLRGDELDDEEDNIITRSYYRCTAIGCNAKKRVDRYMDDPTHVLITYVGLHAHDLPPILPPPSRSFNLYNNSTVSPKLGKGSGVQKPILSDASAGARERMYANNTITSVNVRTGNDSCVNDVGPIEDIGTGLLEDINLSSIAPHYQHHQPTFYS